MAGQHFMLNDMACGKEETYSKLLLLCYSLLQKVVGLLSRVLIIFALFGIPFLMFASL